jgi:DNA-binding MarR family transcriptional regulator
MLHAMSGGKTVERGALTGALTDEVVRFVRLLKTTVPVEPGLDRSALMLLIPLRHEGPMRLRDLAHAKGADPSTVSRQAAQLVRAGLVSSEADPADGRARRLALTEEGVAACRRMTQARGAAIAEALCAWSNRDLSTFTELFREFNACVEAYQQRRSTGHDPSAVDAAAEARQESL